MQHVEVPKAVKIIAIVCTLLGVLGVIDMITFYSTGQQAPFLHLAAGSYWPDFQVYVDTFALGAFVGVGLWRRGYMSRVLAIGCAVVWIVNASFAALSPVFEGIAAYQSGACMCLRWPIALELFAIAVIVYSVWQVRVLISPRVREIFEAP